jgi:tetratricopeptide (TPR) repeat protein
MVCLLAVLSGPAFADDAPANRAREHYNEGTKAYDLQHYAEAAREYEAAYQIKDAPALLFNIGQAYRLGGDPAKAIGAYRSFLRRLPNSPNRNEVQGLIEDLRKTLETQKKPPTGTMGSDPGTMHVPEKQLPPEPGTAKEPVPEPAPQPPPAPKLEVSQRDRELGRTLKYAGLGVGAGGVACVAVGIAFAVLTSQANQKINHPAQNSFFDSSLANRGRLDQTLEGVFLGIGAAAVVAGVGLYAGGAKRGTTPSVVLTPGPGAAGASVGVGF